MATVLIAGGTGLIGNRLSHLLKNKGYEVLHLSRRSRPDSEFETLLWDVEEGYIDDDAILRSDYVINLAGAGVADKRWTAARKKLIIDSRVDSTLLLLSAFRRLDKFPKAYVSSAAIGYYGDRGNELVDETAAPGEGFLSESCVLWEKAIKQIADAGIRTVGIRIGVVLSTQGGALEKMLLSFNFLTGAYFGDGAQWFSWIHIDDLCRMFIYALTNENLKGFYNGVAPNPATNKDLTEKLGKALGKPFVLVPAPAFALRTAMGEMADVVLDSTRVSSEKIEKAGFIFQYPQLPEAFGDLLERKV